MSEAEILVLGKVQNVGFREFATRHAKALWLRGFAQNKGFGELKVVVQGEEENIQKFIKHLQKGPFLARVRDVSVQWREAQEEYSDFSIL